MNLARIPFRPLVSIKPPKYFLPTAGIESTVVDKKELFDDCLSHLRYCLESALTEELPIRLVRDSYSFYAVPEGRCQQSRIC